MLAHLALGALPGRGPPFHQTAAAAAAAAAADGFATWKLDFAKQYPTPAEEAAARANWLANDAIIRAHNEQRKTSFTLAHNHLSDLSVESFAARLLGHRPGNATVPAATVGAPFVGDAPASIDWTARGAVTPIKNQGHCGGCWAFATTGAVEGAFFMSSGNLVSLSEEQLIDCDTAAAGCSGGNTGQALEWIQSGNPLCLESGYPFVASGGTRTECLMSCHQAVAVGGWAAVATDEDALAAAIATHGPIAVAIEADSSAFQLYRGGLFDDASCGTTLDHGARPDLT
jgi:hypothetical protein